MNFLEGYVSEKTRSNSFKLKEYNFRLNIRKKFLTAKMVRLYNRLPVDVPCLEVFRDRLDGVLSNQV